MVIGVWIFLRELGDRHWFATLFMILPRWPFLVPILSLGPLVVVARSWWLRGIIAGAALFILMPLMGFRLNLPNSNPERGDLRLLTFNVHREHVDIRTFADFLDDTKPDVVAIQDWSTANDKRLFNDDKWHVRRDGELLIASRFPIGQVTTIDISELNVAPNENASKGERGAATCFELLSQTQTFNLINLHLSSPHLGLVSVLSDHGQLLADNVQRRWRQSELIRDFVDRSSVPFILAGDFNTTDDSPIFREHWADFIDSFRERGLGLGYTYLVDHTQLRIDHILASSSFKVIRCWVGPDAGSPHRPLLADILFQ